MKVHSLNNEEIGSITTLQPNWKNMQIEKECVFVNQEKIHIIIEPNDDSFTIIDDQLLFDYCCTFFCSTQKKYIKWNNLPPQLSKWTQSQCISRWKQLKEQFL